MPLEKTHIRYRENFSGIGYHPPSGGNIFRKMEYHLEKSSGLSLGFFSEFFSSRMNRNRCPHGLKISKKVLGIITTIDREPLLGTPKASGLNLFDISGKTEKLLVINTHAMNFNFGKPFLRQIESVFETIRVHQGPMIWAGDFNTWSKARFKMLGKLAQELGLEWIIPENDQRFLKLDHILYRGVRPKYATIGHGIKTSDHLPLFAEFDIL